VKQQHVMAVALLASALFGGCGRSPTVYYYALPTVAPGGASGRSISVIVGPVRIPRLLERTEIGHRSGPSRMNFDELHRWAASLEAEVPRAIGEDLARLLGSPQVVVGPADDPTGQAYRVSVAIEQLDAVVNGKTRLRARWVIRRAGEAKPLAVGTTDVALPLGSSEAPAVVESYGAVVEKLSRQIAGRLRALDEA